MAEWAGTLGLGKGPLELRRERCFQTRERCKAQDESIRPRKVNTALQRY
jgi:hypothetical protein